MRNGTFQQPEHSHRRGGAEVARRFRRDRAVVVALLAVLQGGLLFYIVAVAGTAREWRMRNALERHANTARLCARLIDEQCENAVDVLRSIARQSGESSGAAGRGGKDRERHLREAVELVPDLMATALYSADGNLIARHPAMAPFPASAQGRDWFRGVKQKPGPYIGDVARIPDARRTNVVTIAVPVDPAGAPGGEYLLAFYRLGNTSRWLSEVHIRDGVILLSDAAGRVITASTSGEEAPTAPGADPGGVGTAYLRNLDTVDMAMRGRTGAVSGPHPAASDGSESVIGYALARQPRLAVLVVQPAASAFAPTNYLLTRVLWITIPLLVLTPLAAWRLLDYYHREQRLTRRLSEQNLRLAQNARMKSEVLANVSHDLKTPIAGMQLSVSGMRDTAEARDSAAIREGLSLFEQELGRLSARVRNLLDMSRLEGDTVPSSRETCDLTDIAAGALERLRVQVGDRPVSAAFPPEPLLVECDQTEMEIVILNLLENAAKYSPPGSPLHLTGEAVGSDGVLFRLRDEGPGIAASQREHVFGKFYRAGTTYAAGGTGLGLAICKTIVEAHGGTITLEDSDSGGAAFTILLPRASATEVVSV